MDKKIHKAQVRHNNYKLFLVLIAGKGLTKRHGTVKNERRVERRTQPQNTDLIHDWRLIKTRKDYEEKSAPCLTE